MSQPRCAERRFRELSLNELIPSRPLANYVPAVRAEGLVFMSGHGPLGRDGEPLVVGRLGAEIVTERGAAAARLAMSNLIVSLRGAVDSLDRVEKVCQVHGYVRCAPGFEELGEVMTGASELLVDVFGPDVGVHHPRTIAVSECVRGLTVTIDAVFALDSADPGSASETVA